MENNEENSNIVGLESNEKQIKKSSNITLLTVLIIIILCLVGYICYDKGIIPLSTQSNEKNKIEENKQNIALQLDVESSEVKDLMKKTNWFNDDIYEKEKLVETDLDNKKKTEIGLLAEIAEDKNVIHTNTPASQYGSTETKLRIKYLDVDNAVKNIFGKNVSYERVESLKGIAGVGIGCFGVEAGCVGEECAYTLDPAGCDVGWTFKGTYTKLESATKYNDRIEIMKDVVYYNMVDWESNSYKFYKKVLGQEELVPISENISGSDDMKNIAESYYEKASKYKYVFKQEGKSYYFSSAELIQ